MFIEVPCITYDSKTQEITGQNPDECSLIETMRIIDVKRIESLSESIPASDFREDNKVWTQVIMHSGDSFIVNMTYDKLRSHLNDCYSKPVNHLYPF